jgi:SSS family solute:Na+ symporter
MQSTARQRGGRMRRGERPFRPGRRWPTAVFGMAGMLLLAATGAAAEPGMAMAPREATGLLWPDWLIIIAYVGVCLGMGWHYSRHQTDSEDYFIAARRHIHPTLIGISLFATLLSTISYLAKPGEMINKGPMLLLGGVLSVPIAYVVVGYWLIPHLMKQRVTSAYELLEQRLGIAVRLMGAVMFIGLRLAWMGLLIYLSSVALQVIIGVEPRWIPAISAIAGLIAVIYTSLGGLRTVVLTDLFQFALLLLGALLTIAIISVDMGGFSWWSTEWSPLWDRQPWFSLDPTVRVSVFGATVSTLVWWIATAGSDQTAVQRYMATRDARAARRSYLVNLIATIVVSVVLALLGMALLGFFSRYPGALGSGMTLKTHADRIFPYFIANYLPVGLSGLVVAAALAAAMSSVDSGVNSITAVVMSDFLRRFGWHPKTEAGGVRYSKFMALGIGIIVVAASLIMQYVPGNFTEVTTKVANLIVSPIFALFVLALWVPFATPLGAWLGCAYGVAAAVLIGFWDVLTGHTPISFQWLGLGSLVANMLVAIPISRWGPRRDNRRGTMLVLVSGLLLLGVGLLLLLAS